MLEHGGQLRAAARRFGIAFADWIDLSTGINPLAYPVPAIDPACWHRLPEDGDGLETAAAAYYGNESLLVLAGSSPVTRALPTLFPPAAAAFLTPVYAAQAQAWEQAGHGLRRLPTLQRALAAVTPVLLLSNPNKLTGATLPRAALLAAAAELERRGGWLIVDESFGDPQPDNCVAALAGGAQASRLIVLRSLGEFFGLAGARVGFIFGAAEKLDALREMTGPWPVAHPSRAVARIALQDTDWQSAARAALIERSARLAECLAPLGEVSCTALYCTLSTAQGEALFEHFARRAILTRPFKELGLLRFGLPRREADWQCLAQAVAAWKPIP
jgi:cobalamin biosynthetic protein CobC